MVGVWGLALDLEHGLPSFRICGLGFKGLAMDFFGCWGVRGWDCTVWGFGVRVFKGHSWEGLSNPQRGKSMFIYGL